MSCYKRDKSAILRTYHFDLLRQIEVRLLELESKSSFSEILPVYMFLAIHTRTLIQDLCCKYNTFLFRHHWYLCAGTVQMDRWLLNHPVKYEKLKCKDVS